MKYQDLSVISLIRNLLQEFSHVNFVNTKKQNSAKTLHQNNTANLRNIRRGCSMTLHQQF